MSTDQSIQDLLSYLLSLPMYLVCMGFLLENILIVLLVLISGRYIQQLIAPDIPAYSYSSKNWRLCLLTIVLNTIVTYAGFWMWETGLIEFSFSLSWYILPDFIALFFAMDFLMFSFHFLVHKTALYQAIHQLHHQSVNPKPIDLFILHPVETICFGMLWLALLMLYSFNFYSVVVYLFVNVIFGMLGRLGIEPVPVSLRSNSFFKFWGTSSFHHQHHQQMDMNFGFYTTLWDRLFGTLKK